MKRERARELYSDYAEGILSPALAQALEQHFAAEADARADYEQFRQMVSLLDTPFAEEVEVPLGFRAKVLELAAEEHARREGVASRSFTGWLASLGSFRQRRATGGILAAFAVVALAGVLVHQVGVGQRAGLVPDIGSGGLVPTTIRSVTSQATSDGGLTHLFHIHLPATVRQASVMAYVIRDTDQIADPATAMPALAQPQNLTNDEELQIPVTLLRPAPAGATLDLLVQWTPTAPGQKPGSQIVFAPLQAGTAPLDNGDAPISGNFFSALEALAARYGVTVVADAASTPNTPISAPAAGGTALKTLQDVAAQVGDKVQPLNAAGTTFQVYSP